jgi:hypothetical protein
VELNLYALSDQCNGFGNIYDGKSAILTHNTATVQKSALTFIVKKIATFFLRKSIKVAVCWQKIWKIVFFHKKLTKIPKFGRK